MQPGEKLLAFGGSHGERHVAPPGETWWGGRSSALLVGPAAVAALAGTGVAATVVRLRDGHSAGSGARSRARRRPGLLPASRSIAVLGVFLCGEHLFGHGRARPLGRTRWSAGGR